MSLTKEEEQNIRGVFCNLYKECNTEEELN